MNTYPIFDSPLQRSVRCSFALLHNRANRSPAWYGQFVPVTYSLSPEIYPVQMLSLWDCIPSFWLKAPKSVPCFAAAISLGQIRWSSILGGGSWSDQSHQIPHKTRRLGFVIFMAYIVLSSRNQWISGLMSYSICPWKGKIIWWNMIKLRACLYGGGEHQVGEVTLLGTILQPRHPGVHFLKIIEWALSTWTRKMLEKHLFWRLMLFYTQVAALVGIFSVVAFYCYL